jgi:hypothetical protein
MIQSPLGETKGQVVEDIYRAISNLMYLACSRSGACIFLIKDIHALKRSKAWWEDLQSPIPFPYQFH